MGVLKLAIVIPCYNERENIPLIVKRINETFKLRKNIDVILVDNGSNDGSGQVFDEQLKCQSLIRCVKVEKNQGYGYGILAGIAAAEDASFLAWTHADMQTDPKDVLIAFDLLCTTDSDKTIVKGKRSNRPFLDTAFTFIMQVIASIVLGTRVNDVNAQPKVFSRAFFDIHIKNGAPYDFSLDLYLLYQARKANLDILSVPVVFANRRHGDAKGGGSWRTRIKLIVRTLKYIISLKQSHNKGKVQ